MKGKLYRENIKHNSKLLPSLRKCIIKRLCYWKIFEILDLNIVPAVRGDGDYSVVDPSNSLINAKHFSSVRDLADYLLDLDKVMMNISSF